MSAHHWLRASAAVTRGSARVGASAADALQRGWVDRRARLGVLAPGDQTPTGFTGDYFDYRGTARRVGGTEELFRLGRQVNVRRRRAARPVGLDATGLRRHALITGPSQAGKTTSLIVPWAASALRAGFAVIATDVKGDLYELVTAALASDPAGVTLRGARWDYRRADSAAWSWIRELTDERRVAAAAQALVGRERPNDPQPFFAQRDQRLMAGLLTLAHRTGRDVSPWMLLKIASEQRNLLALIATAGDPQSDLLLNDALHADPLDYPRIVAGVVNALQPLAGHRLHRITSGQGLTLDDVLGAPGLVCLGAGLGDGRLGQSVPALALNLLTQRLHERHGAPAWPLLLLIDEAARLTDFFDYEELISTAAAANVSIVLALQDIAQLPEGRVRSTVLGNAQTVVTLAGSSAETARIVSERLGQRPEVDVSYNRGAGARGGTRTQRHASVPTLGTREITELGALFGRRAAVVHSRPLSPRPFVSDLTLP